MILLALLLAVGACFGDGHNQHRSRAALREFRRAHPCPGGPDKGSTTRCRGYVIDHIKALACCGEDLPCNMQYQTSAEGKAKDRWELDCAAAATRVHNACAVPQKAAPRNPPSSPPGPTKVKATPAALPEAFGLIVACKKGGVSPRGEAHLASGWTCVGADASGSKFSVEALSVYDDSQAVP